MKKSKLRSRVRPPALYSSYVNADFDSEIIDTVVTIRGGSSFNPFKWWLHVRCDDPDDKCPCGGTSSTIAYTTNKDKDSGYARINFCPLYFETPNLDQVIEDNSKKDLPVEHRADLRNYVRNKGACQHHVSNP
jgi:hypothetical protein